VALTGDYAFIGATDAVYVFERASDGTWSETQKLTGDESGGARFGESVAISGTTAVVGAEYEGLGGAAYVFARNELGGWTKRAKLLPQGSSGRALFGDAVAIHDDLVLVGAWGDATNVGAAYLFRLAVP
jgi:hypothetical protein